MALHLTPDAQAARDLAKRCVPEGEPMGMSVLLRALFHSSPLKDRFPQFSACFAEPEECREDTPDTISLGLDLRPVLNEIASKGGKALTPKAWFVALLQSESGRETAISAGMDAHDLDLAIEELEADTKQGKGKPGDVSAWRDSPEREKVVKALATFGRMLTEGEPPQKGIVELDRPLHALFRALVKRKQRSAIVIGQPGTGKSALVYEFARLLVAGDPSVPERIRDYDIFELSPTFLRSGASYVGQYEERISSLIKVLSANPKVILFVDEVHSMFQSGIHQRGPFTDANEAFKQAIAMGEVSLIGCTTTAEYRHYIEPDQALAQRFATVTIEPPSTAKTKQIMLARIAGIEEFYGVEVSPDLLDRIVQLTDEYLLGRAQPRKSIQLLDEACAYCLIQDPPVEVLSETEVWQALEDTIGHSIVRDEGLTQDTIFQRLKSKIVGQDDALAGIAKAFVSGMGGWINEAESPRGVLLFSGPTGVGKTETAILLSKILGGGSESILRVDCNTLQGDGRDGGPAQNVLFGPPPGYLGYVRGQGGVLNRIRDIPESVVLFDEIEKADPSVGELLFRIIDDGKCEDMEGSSLDFRRSFIIFTTNAGAVYDHEVAIGFGTDSKVGSGEPATDHAAMEAHFARMGLGQAFLGRVTHFFDFKGLKADSVRIILEAQLGGLTKTAEARGYAFDWEEEVLGHLVSQWQPRFGVRHLVSILRNRVIEQLSVADAQGELNGVERIRLEVLKTGLSEDLGDLAGLARRTRDQDTLVISLV
jgi:ATP-dependent Clp protease ATP-binding subunit ClpC